MNKSNILGWLLVSVPILVLICDGYMLKGLGSKSLLLTVDFVSFIVLPAFSLWGAYKYLNISTSVLGFSRSFINSRYKSFVSFISLSFLLITVDFFVTTILYVGGEFNLPGKAVENFYPGSWLYSMYLSLTAGVVEELFFVAFPVLFIERYISNNKLVISLFVSILLTMAHWEKSLGVIILVFVTTYIGALIFIRFRNIYPLIFSHFFVDFIKYLGLIW